MYVYVYWVTKEETKYTIKKNENDIFKTIINRNSIRIYLLNGSANLDIQGVR